MSISWEGGAKNTAAALPGEAERKETLTSGAKGKVRPGSSSRQNPLAKTGFT